MHYVMLVFQAPLEARRQHNAALMECTQAARSHSWLNVMSGYWHESRRDHTHTHDLDDYGRCHACGEYYR